MEDCSTIEVTSFETKKIQNKIKEVTISIFLEKRPPNVLNLNSSQLE